MARVNVVVSESRRTPVEELRVEIVERKGVGHPDYIADAISEAVSRGLSRWYLERFGVVLHHNVDKVLVVGGQSNPRFGGGEVTQPIYILVSGRATTEVRTEGSVVNVPIGPIVLESTREWLRSSFRFLDVDRHVVIDYRIGKGSADLRALFEVGISGAYRAPLANDTSVGVGFAPMSKLERIVYETERMLNSRDFKAKYPEVGEDVKVMGVRVGNRIKLTVAAAMISSLVKDASHYSQIKDAVRDSVERLAKSIAPEYEVEVHVNTGDKPEHGIYYLTVTGTSAEAGDDGATGRGNRVNGLITPMRPMSMEAAAGKNPVSHVGKLYNVAARRIAERIYESISGVREVYVTLVSQIGKPITEPLVAHLDVVPSEPIKPDVRAEMERIVEEEVEALPKLTEEFVRGRISVF